MAKYDLLLFDADNTLLDFDLAEEKAMENVFGLYRLGYDESILEKYKEINVKLWKDFELGIMDKETLKFERFDRLLKALDIKLDADDFSKSYMSFLSQGGYLMDGALEICRMLSEHCTLAIVTNGIASTQISRLACSAIAPYISHLIVSEDAGVHKPHQGFFEYTFDVCGWADKSKTIIIGDSLQADIKAGLDFGIKTCWYNPAKAGKNKNEPAKNPAGIKADFEIGSLYELPELIL
jgi:YjjG family noncanonical pyrimidine nucleotidase